MAKKAPYNKGFTFVELILVTGIIGVMGLVVYGTFVNGMNIWKTVTEDTKAEDINLFLDRIGYDLRNSFKMTGLRFKGESNKVSFAAQMKRRDQKELKNTLGEITYYLDKRKNHIIRSEANYSQVYRQQEGADKVVAEDIRSLKFRYYVYDELKKTYSWEDFWQNRDEEFGLQIDEKLPLIVEVTIGIPGEMGDEQFVKTVKIPAGCCWPYLEEL